MASHGKLSADRIVVLIDYRESKLINQANIPGNEISKNEVYVGSMDVADVLVCAKYTNDEFGAMVADVEKEHSPSALEFNMLPQSTAESDSEDDDDASAIVRPLRSYSHLVRRWSASVRSTRLPEAS